MEKTKGQKIAYSVITVILAIVLGVILLNRFGVVDFKGEINKTVNSDYYWQSEPFGDLNAVWCLESCDAKDTELLGGVSLTHYLRSADGSKEYAGGSGKYAEEIKKLNYNDRIRICSLYDDKGISYAAIFVPMDCKYATVNGEDAVEAKSGCINTPEGELEFKYITVTYERYTDYDSPRPDTLVLYDENDQAHEFKEDIYE